MQEFVLADVDGTVIIPTFIDDDDNSQAGQIYAKAMPDHHLVPVDARIAVNGGGTIHCLTMHVPAGHVPADAETQPVSTAAR